MTLFSEWNFGLEFAEPDETGRTRQITAEILVICQTCRATLKIKLNLNFRKFAIKAFLKNDIRYPNPKHLPQRKSKREPSKDRSKSNTRSCCKIPSVSNSPARTTKTVKKVPYQKNDGDVRAAIKGKRDRQETRRLGEETRRLGEERDLADKQSRLLDDYKRMKAAEAVAENRREMKGEFFGGGQARRGREGFEAARNDTEQFEARDLESGRNGKRGLYEFHLLRQCFGGWTDFRKDSKLLKKKSVFAQEIFLLNSKRKIFDGLTNYCSGKNWSRFLKKKGAAFFRLRLVCKSFYVMKKSHLYHSRIRNFLIWKLTKEKCNSKVFIFGLLKENHKLNRLKEISWKKALIFRSKKLGSEAFTNWQYSTEYLKRLRY